MFDLSVPCLGLNATEDSTICYHWMINCGFLTEIRMYLQVKPELAVKKTANTGVWRLHCNIHMLCTYMCLLLLLICFVSTCDRSMLNWHVNLRICGVFGLDLCLFGYISVFISVLRHIVVILTTKLNDICELKFYE